MSEEAAPEYTTEQAEALDELATILNTFTVALGKCVAAGFTPSAALEGIGIEVPGFFRGTVDRLLTQQVPPEQATDEEGLQS